MAHLPASLTRAAFLALCLLARPGFSSAQDPGVPLLKSEVHLIDFTVSVRMTRTGYYAR